MDSLSEALLKSEGGAIAAWASTGMTYPDGQTAMSQELYRQVFGNPGIRIGDSVIRAKAATTDIDVRPTWVLLGTPVCVCDEQPNNRIVDSPSHECPYS
jgi:hypothetical protein